MNREQFCRQLDQNLNPAGGSMPSNLLNVQGNLKTSRDSLDGLTIPDDARDRIDNAILHVAELIGAA